MGTKGHHRALCCNGCLLLCVPIKDLPTTETDTVELDVVKKDGKWQLSNSAGVALQEALFPSSVMNSMGN